MKPGFRGRIRESDQDAAAFSEDLSGIYPVRDQILQVDMDHGVYAEHSVDLATQSGFFKEPCHGVRVLAVDFVES